MSRFCRRLQFSVLLHCLLRLFKWQDSAGGCIFFLTTWPFHAGSCMSLSGLTVLFAAVSNWPRLSAVAVWHLFRLLCLPNSLTQGEEVRKRQLFSTTLAFRLVNLHWFFFFFLTFFWLFILIEPLVLNELFPRGWLKYFDFIWFCIVPHWC